MSEVSCNKADESSRSRSDNLDFCSRMAFNSMIDENSFVIIWSFRRKVLYLWPNRAWSRSFYRGAGSFFKYTNPPCLYGRSSLYFIFCSICHNISKPIISAMQHISCKIPTNKKPIGKQSLLFNRFKASLFWLIIYSIAKSNGSLCGYSFEFIVCFHNTKFIDQFFFPT